MVGQNNGRKTFAHFIKTFSTAIPCFHLPHVVNPKHADERLVIRNDLPKQKSEVNRNKKKLKSPKRPSTSGQLSAENSSWAYEQTNVTFGKLLN